MSQNANWQVEMLRVAGLPALSSEIEASKLWDDLMKLDPDMSRIKEGEFDARGVDYANGKMHLVIHSNRVEWLYASKSQSDSAVSGFPIIGSLNEELKVMVEHGQRWFDWPGMPRLKRMAFGGILLKPAESLSTAYEHIQELSPFFDLKQLNNPYDFEFQILRELDSGILEDQLINRQSKWDVVRLRQSEGLLVPREEPTALSRSNFAARLNLQLETEPKRDDELPPDRLSDIFDELVKLGTKLIQEGDING